MTTHLSDLLEGSVSEDARRIPQPPQDGPQRALRRGRELRRRHRLLSAFGVVVLVAGLATPIALLSGLVRDRVTPASGGTPEPSPLSGLGNAPRAVRQVRRS